MFGSVVANGAENEELARRLARVPEWPSLDEMLDRAAADGPPPEGGVVDGPSGWSALELDVATREPGLLSDAELVDAVAGLERVVAWAGARQTRLLAEFARRRPADPRDAAHRGSVALSRWAPDEIGLALSISRSTALARLAQACRLVDVLPGTLDAFESGGIDALKVRAVHDATLYLEPGAARRVQDRVLPAAARQSRAQLVAALARAVVAEDPEGANARHRRARTDRRVAVGQESEGMASLWALLAAPDALAAHEWLTRLARGLGGDDPRTTDQRRADLMVGLLTGELSIAHEDGDDGPDGADGADRSRRADGAGRADEPDRGTPTGHRAAAAGATADESGARSRTRRGVPVRPVTPGKPLVQVVVPYSTLAGIDHQPGDLVGYGPIPADLAREIAADAVWKRLLVDPVSGALLDHGRTTYRPPAALAEFVRARDRYCRSPLCRRRAIDCELDHTVPFPLGPTAEHNLASGCGLHHHEKHSPGWTVVQHRDGRIEWITPTGHAYVSEPVDHRPDPPPPRSVPRSGPVGDRSHVQPRPEPPPAPPPPGVAAPDPWVESEVGTEHGHDPPPF